MKTRVTGTGLRCEVWSWGVERGEGWRHKVMNGERGGRGSGAGAVGRRGGAAGSEDIVEEPGMQQMKGGGPEVRGSGVSNGGRRTAHGGEDEQSKCGGRRGGRGGGGDKGKGTGPKGEDGGVGLREGVGPDRTERDRGWGGGGEGREWRGENSGEVLGGVQRG